MSVNENKVVLDIKGRFENANLVSLLKDSIGLYVEDALLGRITSVSGKDFGRNHKQITFGYSGPRADQLKLQSAFEAVALTMPRLSLPKLSRQQSTSIDTTAYTLEVYL